MTFMANGKMKFPFCQNTEKLDLIELFSCLLTRYIEQLLKRVRKVEKCKFSCFCNMQQSPVCHLPFAINVMLKPSYLWLWCFPVGTQASIIIILTDGRIDDIGSSTDQVREQYDHKLRCTRAKECVGLGNDKNSVIVILCTSLLYFPSDHKSKESWSCNLCYWDCSICQKRCEFNFVQ